jgi:hypothetical protein
VNAAARLDSRLSLCLSLLLILPAPLVAQSAEGADTSTRALLLEHRFGPDSAGNVVLTLERSIVYRAELSGPGTPVFRPVAGKGQPAFLVPLGLGTGAGSQPWRFEVYASRTGPHAVTLADLPPGSTATLRVYRDVGVTRRVAERRDRALAVGFELGGGFHSGYRLDPTGGADPRGGHDVEGGLLAETGDRLGTCFGVGRQSFPDAGFKVTWGFIEERVRLASGPVLGDRLTDLGATVRYSQGLAAGPRNLSPALLTIGLRVTQHLADDGLRRGWSVFVAWQHSRLGHAPETEELDADRLTGGVLWMP